jgi:membrane protein DedA with SNARE-associated domain
MASIAQINHLLASINISQISSLGFLSYLILAVLVALEGPITTLVGAAAASLGYLNPVIVFIAAAVGNLTADTLWYTLGYIGKIEWVNRVGQRMGINMQKLSQMEDTLRDHARKILFISKLTVSPMIPALIATGLIKYPWRRWFPAVFAGEMIWTGSLVAIGYFGIQAITKVQLGLEHVLLAFSIIFVGLVFWFGRKLLKHETQESIKSPENSGD